MQIKIFTIPIIGGEKMNEEMNAFLRSKKILQIERAFSDSGAAWSFCITYLEEGFTKSKGKTKTKVDYKEVLDAESFDRFSQMRVIRKKLAQDEALPAYAIFTDAEMAELAKIQALNLTKMKKIKGIGEKKVEKYGQHFILESTNIKDEKSK